ncbi:LPXTG cell wall anchor domain-containing protein [Streptomyces sp. NPDC094032]|uniref:LPXTG cell wall anchor domain-containing protein n=1 Tax=Streptomyces sp. NPDC094032 TaxID=3155308 RepID=UPI00331B3514
MKFRRILTAAVVVAGLTAPVAVLSAAPAAFADVRQEAKPTIEELRAAVTKAQAVYDAAVLSNDENQKRIVTTIMTLGNGGTHPLSVAADEADKAAAVAATAKSEADARLEKVLADQDAAQELVDEARKAVDEAAAAKTAADEKAKKANNEMVDAQVALAKEASASRAVVDDAREALDAAKKALADAQKEASEKPAEPEAPEESGSSKTPAPDATSAGTSGGTATPTATATATTAPTTGSAPTTGTLAATGSSDATMPIALTGGAAVVLGAGAMVLVRRRKAGVDA